MTKYLLILVCAMSLGASVIFAMPPPQFTCGMHPDVVMDHPGNCPKCGMKLVPVTKRKRSSRLRMATARPAPNPPKDGSAVADVQRPTPNSEHARHRATGMELPGHHHGEHEEMAMESSVSVADPMSREGSGTSWLPDSSPVYGRM